MAMTYIEFNNRYRIVCESAVYNEVFRLADESGLWEKTDSYPVKEDEERYAVIDRFTGIKLTESMDVYHIEEYIEDEMGVKLDKGPKK